MILIPLVVAPTNPFLFSDSKGELIFIHDMRPSERDFYEPASINVPVVMFVVVDNDQLPLRSLQLEYCATRRSSRDRLDSPNSVIIDDKSFRPTGKPITFQLQSQKIS
jgi:hypothetical protein